MKDEYVDLLYSDEYYSELYINSMIPAFDERKKLIGQRKFNQVLEYSHNRGSVLDIGCGVGEVIDVFKDNNWDCHAIEFNPGAVAWLNKKGINVSNIHFNEYNSGMQFDVIMANPPYSVKKWDQVKFSDDPFGRNIWGTPPKGCADYAFQQHIIKSLKPDNGRSVTLWPHGVLFRNSEAEMRKQMIEADLVDAVIGLGKNLFYNSSMESCLLVCNMNKPKNRKRKVIFIDGKDEIRLERSAAYLKDEHIKRISDAYWNFKDENGFSAVVKSKDILKDNNGNLSIQLYVKSEKTDSNHSVETFPVFLIFIAYTKLSNAKPTSIELNQQNLC